MTTIWKDHGDHRLEVNAPNHHAFELLMDNLGGEGVTPETHQFAGLTIPKEDAEQFILELAKAMGVSVFHDAEDETLASFAVEVYDMRSNPRVTNWVGKRYTVSGDINDILSWDEQAALRQKWEKLGLNNGSWSSNYYVADLLAHGATDWTDFELEPEGSCFFLYTNNKVVADQIAEWINNKEFLK